MLRNFTGFVYSPKQQLSSSNCNRYWIHTHSSGTAKFDQVEPVFGTILKVCVVCVCACVCVRNRLIPTDFSFHSDYGARVGWEKVTLFWCHTTDEKSCTVSRQLNDAQKVSARTFRRSLVFESRLVDQQNSLRTRSISLQFI